MANGGVVTLNQQRFEALQSEDLDCHFLYLMKGPALKNMTAPNTFATNKDHEIQELIEKEKYDLIVVTLDYIFVSRLRGLGYKGKIIYDVQGFGTNINELLTNAREQIPTEVIGILSPNTPYLKNLIEHTFPMLKTFYFHNCINPHTFSFHETAKYHKKIIGWVGRIDQNKNWKYFLEIGAEVTKRDPTVELWMFEDPRSSIPKQRKQFKKWVNDLKLEKKLKLYSNVPHRKMANYYSIIGESGGFLCSTSKREGFGYVVLEAMCCRCPVLCTDSGGVKSFVFHNKTGKMIPLKNLPLAVNEAVHLLSDEKLRNELKTNALNYINKHFTPEQYRQNFLSMMKSIGF